VERQLRSMPWRRCDPLTAAGGEVWPLGRPWITLAGTMADLMSPVRSIGTVRWSTS
jgi:hypothetical protein